MERTACQGTFMSNMPESIKDLFEKLQNEILWLHTQWEIYRQLFDHSDKRILFLDTCSSVFVVIHRVLVNEVQLSFSKLSDPARTRRDENLSLWQLQEQVKMLGDEGLSEQLRRKLDEIAEKFKVFRSRRNKRLAHFDLSTSLRPSLNPLPIVSQQMIEDALILVSEYMNTVEGHYCQRQCLYEHGIELKRDADALVTILKFGFRFKELVRDGKIPDDELGKGEWRDA